MTAISTPSVVRVAALADLHCPRTPPGVIGGLLAQIAPHADVLVVAGDLTDHGLPDEARLLARELTAAKVPIVSVLGNHDYEAGKPDEVKMILGDAGVNVLDGDACVIQGVGFAGVKGFAGGFGERALQPWGEEVIKRFVHEAVDEALKLESALAKIAKAARVAVLHYSPIAMTVEGEPAEIYPFLGSSRLEDPLSRYPVVAVFHGHAHAGQPEGRTRTGAPVYNVSIPMLERAFPDRPPFRVVPVEIALAAAA